MAMEFVKQRPIDQIGLVVFAGESFTQYPLSGDHAGLIEQIKGLQSGFLMDGTVIGEGLAKAVERLSTSKSKSKVVILLTSIHNTISIPCPFVLLVTLRTCGRARARITHPIASKRSQKGK